MLVDQILPKLRDRLVTLDAEAPLTAAARLLARPGCEMVVVCDAERKMQGVITRTDVVRQIGHCMGASCQTGCARVMAQPVMSCGPDSPLQEAWNLMKENGLKNLPVRDAAGKPVGLLAVQDAFDILLGEVEYEERLLKEYVMCAGYR